MIKAKSLARTESCVGDGLSGDSSVGDYFRWGAIQVKSGQVNELTLIAQWQCTAERIEREYEHQDQFLHAPTAI
jgi:hypothetical protein